MDITQLVTALLFFALIGFVLYLVVTYIPMVEPFRQVFIVIVVVLVVLYLLALLTGRADMPRLR